jgi:uncharacterized protein (DUF736 family)
LVLPNDSANAPTSPWLKLGAGGLAGGQAWQLMGKQGVPFAMYVLKEKEAAAIVAGLGSHDAGKWLMGLGGH